MATPLVLGIDLGTQSLKISVVCGESGAVVARASAALELDRDAKTGRAEQDPACWAEALRDALAHLPIQASDIGPRIVGIGVSGQQHGAVWLDETGEVLRPAKLWCDTSTAEEARHLTRVLGRTIPPGFTAPKVLWTARHEPEVCARAHRLLLPHDYLNFLLTGETWTEPGDASGTGFFDVASREYDQAAMECVDPRLSSWVPSLIREPHRPAGRVSAKAARAFGLREGVPVAPGSGDNMMSALGAGATREGVVVLSLGTSGTVFGRSERPCGDSGGAVAPFCDALGAWLPLVCVMNMTGVTEDVAALTGLDHAALTDAARCVPPGCGGVTYLPFLQGERVPNLPAATGTLHGLTAGSLTPGRWYRAAVEGASMGLVDGLDRLEAVGYACKEVRVVGGGAANVLWLQTLATLLGRPLRILEDADTAALGAAIAGWRVRDGAPELDEDEDPWLAAAVRIRPDPVEPQPEWRAPLAEARSRRRELLRRLHDLG